MKAGPLIGRLSLLCVLAAGMLLLFGAIGNGGITLTTAVTVSIPMTASPGSPLDRGSSLEEPWPPFVMTYVETSPKKSGQTGMQRQRTRLEFTDTRHIRKILLEDSENPGAVGTWWVYDGTTSRTHRPGWSPDEITTWGPGERTVPADWLVPWSRPESLAAQGFHVVSLGNGLAVASKTDIASNGRTTREERTYRQADGIVTKFVAMVDGNEVRRVETTDLQLFGRGTPVPTLSPPTQIPVTQPPVVNTPMPPPPFTPGPGGRPTVAPAAPRR